MGVSDLPNGWRRGMRLGGRWELYAMSAEQLALETGRDAEAERDRRAIEDACTHPKTRAIGKSRVLSCVRCGATRLPDAPPGPPALR
jgi:hypothetical protein